MGSCSSKLNVLKKGDAVRFGGAGYVYDPDWYGEAVAIPERIGSFRTAREYSVDTMSTAGYYSVKGNDAEEIWKLYDEEKVTEVAVIKLDSPYDIKTPPREFNIKKQQNE